MMQKVTNKRRKINKLAGYIKESCQLDVCEPRFLPNGEVWLRLRSGHEVLDVPIGLKPLFDKKHDNTAAIKTAVIGTWIAYLKNEQRKLAAEMMNG